MDHTQKPKALTDLPLELLYIIAEHLSPTDLACLALCNRLLMFYFAESAFPPAKEYLERPQIKTALQLHIESIKRNLRAQQRLLNGSPFADTDEDLEESQNETRPNTRVDFLARLSRDLPPYYFCHICERLHLWQRVALPGRRFQLPRCVKGWTIDDFYLLEPMKPAIYTQECRHRFYFVHLQLAMRRFYYGPNFGIPVESLFYTQVGIEPLSPPYAWFNLGPWGTQRLDLDYMTVLKSFEARICPAPPTPTPCLRIQELRVATRQNISRMSSDRGSKALKVCHHLGSWGPSPPGFQDFQQFLVSFIDQYRSDPTRKYLVHQQQRCEKCNTSWKLEIRDLWENHVCIVSTRWINLGPGLTPNDARWRLHQSGATSFALPKDQIVENPRVRFEKDSIQSKSPDALSEETLYCRNTELLKGRKYKKVMTSSGNWTWFLLSEEAKKQERSFPLVRTAKRQEQEICVVM